MARLQLAINQVAAACETFRQASMNADAMLSQNDMPLRCKIFACQGFACFGELGVAKKKKIMIAIWIPSKARHRVRTDCKNR